MQMMQIPTYIAYRLWQECSTCVVVVILPCSSHLWELDFATHTTSGPGDYCTHFQRQSAFYSDAD